MTPWGSWVTCEEIKGGKVWQVDPEGQVKGRQVAFDAVST